MIQAGLGWDMDPSEILAQSTREADLTPVVSGRSRGKVELELGLKGGEPPSG